MAALVTNRKRKDDCSNFNCLYPSLNSPDFQISKRTKFSCIQQIPDQAAVSLNTTVLRLSRYPKETLKFRGEIHAPCRIIKFGLSKKLNSHSETKPGGIFQRGVVDDVPGVVWSYNYQSAKSKASGALGYLQNKAVIDLESEKKEKTVGVSEDLSIEEVEIIEEDDREEGRFMVSDQRSPDSREVDVVMGNVQELDPKILDSQSQPSSSSVVSYLTNGNLDDNAEKMFDVLLQNQGMSSVYVYKKLVESVERRASRLRSLDFEIKFNEKCRSRIQSLRQAKKTVKDVPQEPFLPLTEEEEAEVARAFSTDLWRKVLVTHENSNIQITGKILQCLRPHAWLNDEVINVYLELLKERESSEPKKFLKCHFFNTFFYKKLTSGNSGYDYKSVRRWTSQRKLGYRLSECDKIFVPVHKEIHWCLAVINKKEEKFQYLDSLKGIDLHVLKKLARYFIDEVKDKSGEDIDVSSWKQEYVEDLPEQENGFDCGVFMIKYADFYSRGLELCFSQEHMPYFRLRTAKEILRLKAD